MKDVGYTCETAEYFQLYHVTSRIEQFEAELQRGVQSKEAFAVKELFPFMKFFANAPAVTDGDGLFGGKDLDQDLEVARGCFRHVNKVCWDQEGTLGCFPWFGG